MWDFWRKRNKEETDDDRCNPSRNRMLLYEPEEENEEDFEEYLDDPCEEDPDIRRYIRQEHFPDPDDETDDMGDEHRTGDVEPDDSDLYINGTLRSRTRSKKEKVIALVGAVIMIFALICISFCRKPDPTERNGKAEKAGKEEMVSITESGMVETAPAQPGISESEDIGTEKNAALSAEPDTPDNSEKEETGVKTAEMSEKTETEETTEGEARAVNTDSYAWQETVFGSHAAGVVTYSLSVKGLTENEKNLTGFRESDFIRELSAFLSANNLRASAVKFTGSVSCSADHAAAYTADLKGIADWKLMVVFYPEYPGQYLFSLIQKESDNRKEEADSRNSVSGQQLASAASSGTTNAAPVTPQPQQIIRQTPQPQTEPQKDNREDTPNTDTYDAMSLSLGNLPGEVENYLSNSYELQYGLYDYLYHKGIRNASKASVTDYYIDAEDRSASIQIRVEGIGNVTAIYDRDSNSYSFQ